MKVLIVTVDESAVAHYRIREPVRCLTDESGLTIEIQKEIPLMVDPDDGDRFVGFGPSLQADVVVLHQPMFKWVAEGIRELQARGIKVVVELDDDYSSLHPLHQSYYLVDPAHCPPRNWKHLLRNCAEADLVTATTETLAKRYAPHGRYAVLRNYVPRAWLDIPHFDDGRTVGWTGGTGVHPNDLQCTGAGVSQAIQDCGGRFLCVGGGKDVQRNLGLYAGVPFEATGWVDMSLYPALIARMSVGLVPLADTRFNHSKSWLKGVEYAALGVPFVASDVPSYRELHELHPEPLAKPRSRDWRREVKRMLQDPELRQERSDRGREVVRDSLTIEDNAWRWAEAWASVLDREEVYA